MTSPEYQAPTWVNEDDPAFVEGVSPDLGAGYLNALSGAVEGHGQRLGAVESDVTTLQATALDQADGDARYILQSNANGFAPAEATANALAGKAATSANLSDLASAATARTNLGLAAAAASGKLADLTDVTTTGASVGKLFAVTQASGGALQQAGLITPRVPVGNTIVLLGNSRVARDLSGAQNGEAGFFTWANARAGGRFNVVNCAGVSGDTLTQMNARWGTAVTPYAPAWVLLADAVNDATGNRTSAQMIADAQTMLDRARQEGARVILLTSPPNNAHTVAQRNALLAYNVWVKSISDGWTVPVDVATTITDPSTGGYAAVYSADGLHQNPQGAARISRVLAPVLASLIPARDPFPSSPLDTRNAVLNPWIAGTPGAGFPTNWTTVGTATFSTVARSDAIPGNWLQIDTTAGTFDCYARQGVTALPTGFVVGDIVRLITEVQIGSLTSCVGIEAYLQFRDTTSANVLQLAALANNDAGTFPLTDLPASTESMIFASPPVAIPATTTQTNLLSHFNGQGVVRFGRHALVKV